jgi:hypothetical protein
MSEDEADLESESQRQIWRIKRDIKVSFSRYGKPPETKLEYFSHGCEIGKGPYGKVSLAKHILTG